MQRDPHDDLVFEDAAQEDAAHEDAAHEDAAHEDAAHEDAAHEDAAHEDAAHEDAAHEDAAHEEAAPVEAAHDDEAQVEAAQVEAAHEEAAHDRQRIADLEDEIAELSAHIDAATARLLVAIAEFDQRQGWSDGFVSCAHWLSWRVGIDRSTAREKVRVARALTNLPCITTALARGQVSYSKVREVTRVATPENEAELVALCQAGTASHVQRIVRAYRRCEQAELDTADRQREGRYLSLRTDDDGMLVVEGRLPPEVGALLTRALEVAEQELRGRTGGASAEASAFKPGASAEASAFKPGASAEASAFKPGASAEASTREPGASAEASACEPVGTRCQRRADALGLVAERALAGSGTIERGEPCQVVLHVDAAVLAGQQVEGGRCHLEDGPALAAETARRLSCDAPTVTLIEDFSGQPLDVGRKTRRVSTALFRALKTRDQTCQFPGCDHTGKLTPHHITHWATGGTTNKDNICLLCPPCHWRVHEGGCEVRGRAPDALTFFSRGGIELKALPDPAPPLPEDPVAALKALHVAEGLDIRPETNVIWWQGERWDLGWAVESLLSYRHSSYRHSS